MVKNPGDCAVRATPAALSLGWSALGDDAALPFSALRQDRAERVFAHPYVRFAESVQRPAECGLGVRLLVLSVAAEVVDHRGIGERRGVAEIAVLVFGDLAQDSAHDLPRARLRQAGRELNEIGRGDRADLLAHPGDQLLA